MASRFSRASRSTFSLASRSARSAASLALTIGPLLLAHLARGSDGLPLLAALDHVRVVGTRPRLEFLERLLSRLGGPCEPLLHVLVLVAAHCILLGRLWGCGGHPDGRDADVAPIK